MSAGVAKPIRLLYIMHVDWSWIRQRPHEFAERLPAAGYDVRVLCTSDYRAPQSGESHSRVVRVMRLPILPWRRFAVMRRLNAFLHRLWVEALVRTWRPRVIWVTHPRLVDLVPKTPAAIVYDAMDLARGFSATRSERRALEVAERELCERAQLVITPSELIREDLLERFGRTALLIRNAINREVISVGREPLRPGFRILYVGTISEWLDFDVCCAVLDDIESASLHLVGPLQVKVPTHPRLTYGGIVPHSLLSSLASKYDILVIPFRLTELTRAVDPVKLYEYLAWRRPIITVDYPEISRFRSFVCMYTNASEFSNHVLRLNAADHVTLPDRSLVEDFLSANDWAQRTREAVRALRAS